ncbi:MAG: nucleoid-associated protein [Rhodocyclaceae bacterium]
MTPLKTDLILHRLIKTETAPLRFDLRATPLPASEATLRLLEHIASRYTDRATKSYGRFEEDESTYPVANYLRQHIVDGSLDFVAMSHALMSHLQTCADEEGALPPYALVARTYNAESDTLWVALLGQTEGSAVGAGLDVADVMTLDTDNIALAGRIDVTAWMNGAERYVSFLKGRGEVAPFFKRFLGCDDVIVALKETRKLVERIQHFADAEQIDAPVRDQLMERAHVYLDELGESREPVRLEEVAAQVWPDAPARLSAVLQEEEAELAGGFVPDRRAIKALVRFKAKASHWKVEFDRSSLRSGEVIYDRASDTLVLSNIPDNLKRLLLDE